MIRKATCAALAALALVACDNGYTTQQAVEACDIERANKTTLDDAAYAGCVACYETCGADCTAEGTTPETYSCPE